MLNHWLQLAVMNFEFITKKITNKSVTFVDESKPIGHIYKVIFSILQTNDENETNRHETYSYNMYVLWHSVK